MAPKFVDISGKRHFPNREPDTCPLCHLGIDAQEHKWTLCPASGQRNMIMEVLYQCPLERCRRYFIARYFRDSGVRSDRFGELNLFECVPVTPTPAQIPAEVADISPDFPKIYDQALAAEAYGLDEIAGGGFRKALEFLVKDYCIHLSPNEKDKIRNTNLAMCISQYVERPEIKIVANRAAWLGNDELHFVRKWEPDDLKTLKDLIKLTISWVDDSVRTAKYEEDMQPK